MHCRWDTGELNKALPIRKLNSPWTERTVTLARPTSALQLTGYASNLMSLQPIELNREARSVIVFKFENPIGHGC